MAGMKCVKCGKIAAPAMLSLEGSKVNGWSCSCGEQYLDSHAVERLFAIRRLQKEHLTAKVTRQGNSYALRVPMAIVQAYGLMKKRELRILPQENNFLLEA